ncbi:MAG: YkgJ family cysteine cluster protein [Candidatus Micrarchaeia archaeon]
MAVKVNMEPRPEENMCIGCEMYCCSLYAELTSYDILRIAIGEKKEIDSFVDWTPAEADDALAFRCEGKMVKFVLKHGGTHCIFFRKDEPLKCSVEPHKPSVCLAYPFSLRSGKLMGNALCPPGNLLRADSVKMSQEVLADCRWEVDSYYDIVADWNLVSDGSEDIEDFLRFASAEMDLEMNPLGSLFRKARRKFLRAFWG